MLLSRVMICRWLLALGAPLSLLAVPAFALADEPPGCPPGEWFCDDDEPAAPDPDAPQPDVPDAAATEPEAPPDIEQPSAEPDSSEEHVEVAPMTDAPGWSEASPARWAIALRGEGVLLDSGSDHARLGGVGASLRYLLTRAVTFDLGFDSILGTDYDGHDRSELSLSLSTLFFLNQGDLLSTFVLVGMNVSSARVDVQGDEQSWGYFGGHAGLGLELAVDSRFAFSIDAVGFMRGRTDSRAAGEPEFTDSSGRVTNTSGGGLIRGGVVLRF